MLREQVLGALLVLIMAGGLVAGGACAGRLYYESVVGLCCITYLLLDTVHILVWMYEHDRCSSTWISGTLLRTDACRGCS